MVVSWPLRNSRITADVCYVENESDRFQVPLHILTQVPRGAELEGYQAEKECKEAYTRRKTFSGAHAEVVRAVVLLKRSSHPPKEGGTKKSLRRPKRRAAHLRAIPWPHLRESSYLDRALAAEKPIL